MEYIISFDSSKFSELIEPPMAHVSASIGHNIFLIGGYRITFDNDLRTIIAFDKNNLLYYNVLNSQLDTVELSYDMESVGSFPTEFFCASGMACCSNGNRIYLFGGYSLTKQEVVNALYYIEISKSIDFTGLLNIKKLCNKKPKAVLKFLSGSHDGDSEEIHRNFPSYRDKASIVYWRNNIIVFGGYGSNFIRSEIQDNIDQGHNFLADNGEYVSGSGNRGWNNQLLIFSMSTNRWTNPATFGSIPCPRAAHSSAITDSKLFIFGGRLGMKNTAATVRSNEFYYLDLITFYWTKINLSDSASIIGRSWTTLTCVYDEVFFIVGGFSGDNVPLSDAYIVKIDKKPNVGKVTAKLRCFQSANWDPYIDRSSWNTSELFTPASRMWHSSCLAADGFIYIIGGCRNDLASQIERIQTRIERIRPEPLPLYRLCLWSVFLLKPNLNEHEIPQKLFNDLLSLCF